MQSLTYAKEAYFQAVERKKTRDDALLAFPIWCTPSRDDDHPHRTSLCCEFETFFFMPYVIIIDVVVVVSPVCVHIFFAPLQMKIGNL